MTSARPGREPVTPADIMRKLATIGPRPHGSAAAKEAAEYLEGLLRSLELDVSLEPYEARRPSTQSSVEVHMATTSVGLESEPFLESPSGSVEGGLSFDGYLRIWGMYEWPVWSVRSDDRVEAYVVACSLGEPIAEHLPPEVPPVPHVAVSLAGGEFLSSLAGSPRVTLRVTGLDMAPGVSIRAWNGADPLLEDQPRPLLVAHYDTVPRTPGVYDNAAGVAAAICAVTRLREQGTDVHLLLTGAEELGLAGSRAVVSAWQAAGTLGRVSHAIVLDGGGRGRRAEAWVSAPKDDAIFVAALRSACDEHGYTMLVRRPAPPGSDHAAFLEAGVPAVMYTVNDTAILHRPDDVFDDRKVEAAACIATAAAHAFIGVHQERQGRASAEGATRCER